MKFEDNLQSRVDYFRKSVRLDSKATESDPEYDYSDSDLLSILEYSSLSLWGISVEDIPPSNFPIVLLKSKLEVYMRLATTTAPFYEISAEGASLKKNMRFDHYDKLIKRTQDEYDKMYEREFGKGSNGDEGNYGVTGYLETYNVSIDHIGGKYKKRDKGRPTGIYFEIEEIKHSYAIVLDSATETRVDGPFKEAKRVLNIDHHPNKSPYGDEYLVDETRSSTCEIVAELLIEKAPLSKTNANYLLAGILTDTIRFMIENTKTETLEVAAKLMRFGANINDLSRHFFNGTYDSFKIRTYLSNHVEYEGQLATLTITKAMRETLNISERVAKSYYTVMSGVSEFGVYAVFVETDEGH